MADLLTSMCRTKQKRAGAFERDSCDCSKAEDAVSTRTCVLLKSDQPLSTGILTSTNQGRKPHDALVDFATMRRTR